MSMEKLSPGQIGEINEKVTTEMTTNRTGKPGDDVLSTPSLLNLMEMCCMEASDRFLPEGHTTVGYAVDGMRHMAPTAIGKTVTLRSKLTEVDRNRLTYSIEAFEGDKKIGVATHKRAVISRG